MTVTHRYVTRYLICWKLRFISTGSGLEPFTLTLNFTDFFFVTLNIDHEITISFRALTSRNIIQVLDLNISLVTALLPIFRFPWCCGSTAGSGGVKESQRGVECTTLLSINWVYIMKEKINKTVFI